MNACEQMREQEKGSALLIIDPQVDFHPGGSLEIPTADDDATRIAELIKNLQDVSEIYVTLDSHLKYHIAHPLFWMDAEGKHPQPYTKITSVEIESKVWRTSRKEHQQKGESYVAQLAKGGKFELIVWPEHCLIGTPGHAVSPIVAEELAACAIKAEVIVKSDKHTWLNGSLLTALSKHDYVFVCGQAKSHCVNFTLRDILEYWNGSPSDLVLVEDATSPVPNFENSADDFVRDMKKAGIQVLSVKEILQSEHTKRKTKPKISTKPGSFLYLYEEDPSSLVQKYSAEEPEDYVLYFHDKDRRQIPSFRLVSPVKFSLTEYEKSTLNKLCDYVHEYMKTGILYYKRLSVNPEALAKLGLLLFGLNGRDCVEDLCKGDSPVQIHLKRYVGMVLLKSKSRTARDFLLGNFLPSDADFFNVDRKLGRAMRVLQF